MRPYRRMVTTRGKANPLLQYSRMSEGGAHPALKMRSDVAVDKATNESGIPWILAKLYAPSPIVNMDQSRIEGQGMFHRVYVPAGESPPTAVGKSRGFGEKITQWFKTGDFK